MEGPSCAADNLCTDHDYRYMVCELIFYFKYATIRLLTLPVASGISAMVSSLNDL